MKRFLLLAACVAVTAAAGTPRLELGVAAPLRFSGAVSAGLGVVGGVWGGNDLPLVLRLTVAAASPTAAPANPGLLAQLDLGLELDPGAVLEKYLVITTSALGGTGAEDYLAAGFSAGVRWKGLFAQLGPGRVFRRGHSDFWALHAMAGYSWTL